MNKNTLTIIGFLLFVIGFLSVILSLVGLQLSYLKFLESLGSLGAFVVKLVMIFGGIIIMYISKTSSQEA